jgi:plastocyanin
MTRLLLLVTLLTCTACISDNVAALRYHDVPGVAATVHILDSPETVGEYSPNVVHVRVGQTVAFVNASGDYHTVTFVASPADAPSSVGIAPAQTFKTTLHFPGVYWYRCLYHPGMVGEIIVGAAP